MSGKAETNASQILTQRFNWTSSVRKINFLVDQFGLQSYKTIDYSLNLADKFDIQQNRTDMRDLAVAIERTDQKIHFLTANQLSETPGKSSLGLIPSQRFYLPREIERAALLLELFDHDHVQPWSEIEFGNYLSSAANLFASKMDKIISEHQNKGTKETVKYLLGITGQRATSTKIQQAADDYNDMFEMLDVTESLEYARVAIAAAGKYHNITVLTEFAVKTGSASQAYLFRAVKTSNRFDREMILHCAQIFKRYLIEFDLNFLAAFKTRIDQLSTGQKETPLAMKPPVLVPPELACKLID